MPASSPRGLSILGSTGSVGTQTLEVAALFPERFVIHGLTAGSNVDLLAEQARRVRPQCVAIADASKAATLRDRLADTAVEVLAGADGLREVATLDAADLVMGAVVGFAGLPPVLAALRAGKDVALANKETLVVAGALVTEAQRAHGAHVLPVDSEHSAIFQCLTGEDDATVERIVLTASGGPFRTRDPKTFSAITPAEALDHPNWSMGSKITIDSATLMNKGLEVIEARWLFDLAPDAIDVLVHPQSIIHSMVAFSDGSMKAQLGVPDMKVPIQYALSYPERWPAPHERLDWTTIAALDFEPPNTDAFPCLRLAYDALRAGGTAPAVLNAANEVAVALFLDEAIGFMDIPRAVEEALQALAAPETPRDLDTLRAADAAARRHVKELLLPA
ncbi:1-deoxy-D-xylulose-5-phosphate reductoisomerase [Salisaeta longa]|uniref:1-deoxy-D-xylulose-5-phosphate reductoisomerase n=1 Tax=Salisaeta longa TaxID=503170 RepID=UPI000687FCDE|nr:1-deoxy-D-xylulose-5-phosphate reductoisomerase [Salisaeta longa]